MVLLGRSYKGYLAGAIVQLSSSEEAALIAQGLASNSNGPVTSGIVSTSATSGRVSIGSGGATQIVNNPLFDVNSKFAAYVTNGTADATGLRVERIVPGAGTVTFALNAAATGTVTIDWLLLPSQQGLLPPN